MRKIEAARPASGNRAGALARRFIASRDGSTAMLFALSFLPLLFIAGAQGCLDGGRVDVADVLHHHVGVGHLA